MKFNEDLPAYLFSNCIPVKGHTKSSIYDIQRESFSLIPNELYEIISTGKILPFSVLKDQYGEENHPVLLDYFKLLFEKEYIHQIEDETLFPEIDTKIEKPSLIHDAIIALDIDSNYDINGTLDQLETLGCHHLEIRLLGNFTFEKVMKVIDYLHDRTIYSANILVQKHDDTSIEEYKNILVKNFLIKELILFGVKEKKPELAYPGFSVLNLDHVDHSCCGNISKNYFRVNIDFYNESLAYNNCLYKKISINEKGEIKNCPSSNEVYGKITDVSLFEALHSKDFKNKWGVSKDKVEICRDCEYRYMCSDCRVFIEDEKNIYSKPSKCGYNPYNGAWED